jgi:hypothetical protein
MRVKGGYSAVAKHLTEVFGLVPELDRRQVYQWSRRGTVNAAGQMFPSPAAEVAAAEHRPRLLFDLTACAAWYAAGVPGRWANQSMTLFESPAERNARYAADIDLSRFLPPGKLMPTCGDPDCDETGHQVTEAAAPE